MILSIVECALTVDIFILLEKDEPNEKNTIVFGLHARCEVKDPRRTGITSLFSLGYISVERKRRGDNLLSFVLAHLRCPFP